MGLNHSTLAWCIPLGLNELCKVKVKEKGVFVVLNMHEVTCAEPCVVFKG